jgi:hypothetical protein
VVMAIKKVPSDASVRIGSIWFPVRNLPAALARHTKLVFCLTGLEEHPYSIRGSATGLKFQDLHLLFCCGHQIANVRPRDVVIPLDKEGRMLISGQQMVKLDPHVDELHGEEILDVTAMRFDPAKYGASRIDLGFFDINGADVWNGDPETTFLVFGYPTNLRSVQIDDVSGALSGLKVKMISTSASYVKASQASGLHAIRLQRSGDYTSDGLSGGTVYHVGEDAQGFYCGFAGLVILGSDTSDILHFIDSRAIFPFFKHQKWLSQNDPAAQ